MIKLRRGGAGLKYSVPMSVMPKLVEINRTIQDPLARYNAVMAPSAPKCSKSRPPSALGPVRLSIGSLEVPMSDPFGVSLKSISLDVHGGEVVAIAGIAG